MASGLHVIGSELHVMVSESLDGSCVPVMVSDFQWWLLVPCGGFGVPVLSSEFHVMGCEFHVMDFDTL